MAQRILSLSTIIQVLIAETNPPNFRSFGQAPGNAVTPNPTKNKNIKSPDDRNKLPLSFLFGRKGKG